MEFEIWKIFTSLGVPGLVLGVFYMLLKNFQWKFPVVPKAWVGPLILLFMLLVGSITFYTLTLWAPNKSNIYSSNEQQSGNDTVINTSHVFTKSFNRIATIPIGSIAYYPDSIIDLNNKSKSFFIATSHNDKHSLKVLSLVKNSITLTIDLERRPEAVFSSTDGDYLFVLLTVDYSNVNNVNEAVNNEILVFNTNDFKLKRRLYVITPQDQRLTKGVALGSQIYLTQFSLKSSLFIVNSLNGDVVKTIPLGSYPSDILVSNEGTKVYVSTETIVSVINTSTLEIIKKYRFYDRINQFDLDSKNELLYTTHWEGGISIMNILTEKIEKKPDIFSWGIAVDSTGKVIYIIDSVSGKLKAFDTNSFENISSISLGTSPKAIIKNEVDSKLYITNTEDGTISIIDCSEFRI